jgi:outer membrane biosynthesis protein TonB
MDCKAHKLLIGLLLTALAASWAWFYSTQQQTNAQLALLLSKANASSGKGSKPGKPAFDPYQDEAVKNTLRQHTADIQKLWLAYLDPAPQKTEGVIETDWQIGANGEVLEANIVHSDFADAALNDGLLSVLKSIQYPPPPTGMRTTITHTFKLKKAQEVAAPSAISGPSK